MATYSEKLKDPRWQKKRLEIFNRDEFKCVLCGDDKSSLHIHHTYYKNGVDIWDYPDDSLLTYCEFCHKIVEYLKKENSVLIPIKFKKFRVGSEKVTILCIVKNIDTDKHELVIVSLQDFKIIDGLYFSYNLLTDITFLLSNFNSETDGK